MKHPHDIRCFYCYEKPDTYLSVREIRQSVFDGQIAPWGDVFTTDGAMYPAQQIANYEEPRWARTLLTDRILGFTDADSAGGITDKEFDALIADLPDDAIEDLPPEGKGSPYIGGG